MSTPAPIVYHLPGGPRPAIAIGDTGWAGSALHLPAPPDGVPVAIVGDRNDRPVLNHDGGCAHALRLAPGVTCWLNHVDLIAGAQDDNNTCILSGSLGSLERSPSHIWMADVMLSSRAGQPRQPMWGMQLSQTSVNAEFCVFIGQGFREHAVYGHNTPELGLRFVDCDFLDWGGQCVKDVTRLAEGPNYGRHLVYLRDVKMKEWGLDPSRASCAIDVGGAGADVTLERVLARSERKGGLAMWNPSGAVANESLSMRHVAIWCPKADRPVLQATVVKGQLEDVYLGGPRASEIVAPMHSVEVNGINDIDQIHAAARYLDEDPDLLAEAASTLHVKAS